MGVKYYKNLLKKTARAFAANQVNESLLYNAAELLANAKTKARDSRDKWKINKRLGT